MAIRKVIRMNKPMTEMQQDAEYLLTHPAEYGRRLGYTKLRDDLHGQWIDWIVWGQGDMTLQAHRGSYKTTSVDVAVAIMMQKLRDKNIIYLRKTDDDVTEVIQAVRDILLHPLTQTMCQVLTGKPLEIQATSKKITTSLYSRTGGTPQLLGIGMGGSLTGKHADIIITDDIINKSDRASKAERKRTKDVYQELQNLLNRGGRIINFGTPWHKEDAFTLMPKPIRFDCYHTGLMTPEEIADLKLKMSPSLFAANYELKHLAAEEALFTTIPPQETKEEVLYNGIAHIDAAYGGGDYTAFTCAQKRGGKLYLYGRLWHKHVDSVMNVCLAEAKRFRCGPIYCEKNADKGYLARELKNRGAYVFTYPETENKYIKISTYLRKYWPNVVIMAGTDSEYLDQILDYTDAAEHDDAPDSASCCCRVLDKR